MTDVAPGDPRRTAAPARKASTFLEQFHAETNPPYPLRRRLRRVRAEIDRTGTYVHTEAEMEFGARVAWRNAARCIGRLCTGTACTCATGGPCAARPPSPTSAPPTCEADWSGSFPPSRAASRRCSTAITTSRIRRPGPPTFPLLIACGVTRGGDPGVGAKTAGAARPPPVQDLRKGVGAHRPRSGRPARRGARGAREQRGGQVVAGRHARGGGAAGFGHDRRQRRARADRPPGDGVRPRHRHRVPA